MKKKICFVLTTLLILAMSICVYAETTQTDGGSVTFDGDAMNSTFSSSVIATSVSEMQPGDSVSFQVTLSNTSQIETDWYMSNDVLSSLEDAQKVAQNGGYTYILTYTSKAGDVTTIYSSDSVGGEKETDAGAGLNEATDSLDEFFYLDHLGIGDTGVVSLFVSLDGESQGNAYQDTLAKLKMNFAVETANKTIVTTPVKTGDVWFGGSVIALVAGIVLVVAAVVIIRKKEAKKS